MKQNLTELDAFSSFSKKQKAVNQKTINATWNKQVSAILGRDPQTKNKMKLIHSKGYMSVYVFNPSSSSDSMITILGITRKENKLDVVFSVSVWFDKIGKSNKILTLIQEMVPRQPPFFRSLPRKHPLNKIFGKIKYLRNHPPNLRIISENLKLESDSKEDSEKEYRRVSNQKWQA